jgi:short-subunit dehydrogenase
VRHTPFSVCSGLVVLGIRPLSAYQQQLVDTVFRLRSLGCSDPGRTPRPPDVVFANACVSIGTLTEAAEDEQLFREVLETNVIGVMNTFQPYVAAMRERGHGILVGIASVAGYRGLPGAVAYSASKAAAIRYLESLRVELRGSGIHVITVCPDYIDTAMTAKNPYRMPFIMDADRAAAAIAGIVARRKSYAVIPWQMALVAGLMYVLPRPLYDTIAARAGRKPRRGD